MKETVGDGERGIEWTGGKRLTDLDYADDIVLFSKETDKIQELLDTLSEKGRKSGLKINESKTEIMKTENVPPGNVLLNNRNIKEVDSFKYLGTIISKTGSLELEFTERIKKANQVMGMLSKVWKSRRLTIQIKIRLYMTLVRSVLTYGRES